MKIKYFAFILVILTIVACRTVRNNTTSNNTQENTDKCPPIVLDTAGIYTAGDEFLLIGAELKGKCLEIEVEYSGGCGEDTWTLAWTGSLMKSLPPKANIYLHLKDDDPCREVVRKKVSFDISSIYKDEVILILKDFRGVLTYKP
jgi:hypothetical protein